MTHGAVLRSRIRNIHPRWAGSGPYLVAPGRLGSAAWTWTGARAYLRADRRRGADSRGTNEHRRRVSMHVL